MRPRTAVCLLILFLFSGTTILDRALKAQSGGSGLDEPDPGRGPSVAHLANAHDVRKRLGLVPEYEGVPGLAGVKVAVLDYGFDGAEAGRPYLPAGTQVVEHYDPDFVRRFGLGDPAYRKPFEPGNRHGRIMAQILWAVTGSHPEGPKFYLLNASGPTMLRRAVRFAIEQGVDLILFSGSFEGGGNGDGRGPIDRIVADASAAGIPWINAAGNYGGRVYNGPVRILADGYLRLRDGSDVAALRFRNRVDENTVTVTLTWSDYREEEDAGSDKDLDLYVEDWAGRRIGAGDKTQVAGHRVPGPGESRNPRERVVLSNLPASPNMAADPDYTYRIRIRAKRGHFVASDRLRVLLSASKDVYEAPGGDSPGEAVEFLDASGDGEIYPPADHPMVLTVGDSDPSSSIGPTADRRLKPDALLEDSRAFFSDGQVSAGSSNAAAYVAGVVAVLKAAEPGLQPRHLLMLAQQGPLAPDPAPARDRSSVPTRPAAPSPDERRIYAVDAAGYLHTAPRQDFPTTSRRLGTNRSAGLRVWRTPTRAQLARLIGESR